VAIRLASAVVEIRADGTRLLSELETIHRSVAGGMAKLARAASAPMQQMIADLSVFGKKAYENAVASRQIIEGMSAAGRAAEAAKKRMAPMMAQLSAFARTAGVSGRASDEMIAGMSASGMAAADLQARIAAANKQLVVIQPAAMKAATAIASTGKAAAAANASLSGLNAGLFGVSRGAATFARQMAAAAGGIFFLGTALRDVIGFNSEFAKATAKLTGITAQQRKELEQLARSLSRELGVSATDVAKTIKALASSGLDATEILASLRTAVAGVVVSEQDAETTTKQLVQTMNSFGLRTNDAAENARQLLRIQNLIIVGADAATTDYASFAEALSRVGGRAQFLGLTLEKAAAVLLAFSGAGLEGAASSSGFEIALRDLTKRASEIRAAFGVNILDTKGELRDIPDIIAELNKAFAGLSLQTKIERIQKAKLQDKSQRFLIFLVQQSEALLRLRGGLENVGDALEKQLQARLATLEGQMNILRQQFVDIGLTVLPPVIQGFLSIVKVIGAVSRGLVLLDTALGGALDGMLKLVSSLAAIRLIVSALTSKWIAPFLIGLKSMTVGFLRIVGTIPLIPFFALGEAIKLLGSGFVLAGKGIKRGTEELRIFLAASADVLQLIPFIGSGLSALAKLISLVLIRPLNFLGDALIWIGVRTTKFGEGFIRILDKISPLIGALVVGGFAGLIKVINDLRKIDVVEQAFKRFARAVELSFGFILRGLQKFGEVIAGHFMRAIQSIFPSFSAALDKNVTDKLKDLPEKTRRAAEATIKVLDFLAEKIVFWSAFVGSILEDTDIVLKLTKQLGLSAIQGFIDALNAIPQFFIDLWNDPDILKAAEDFGHRIGKSIVGGMATEIAEFFSPEFLNKLRREMKQLHEAQEAIPQPEMRPDSNFFQDLFRGLLELMKKGGGAAGQIPLGTTKPSAIPGVKPTRSALATALGITIEEAAKSMPASLIGRISDVAKFGFGKLLGVLLTGAVGDVTVRKVTPEEAKNQAANYVRAFQKQWHKTFDAILRIGSERGSFTTAIEEFESLEFLFKRVERFGNLVGKTPQDIEKISDRMETLEQFLKDASEVFSKQAPDFRPKLRIPLSDLEDEIYTPDLVPRLPPDAIRATGKSINGAISSLLSDAVKQLPSTGQRAGQRAERVLKHIDLTPIPLPTDERMPIEAPAVRKAVIDSIKAAAEATREALEAPQVARAAAEMANTSATAFEEYANALNMFNSFIGEGQKKIDDEFKTLSDTMEMVFDPNVRRELPQIPAKRLAEAAERMIELREGFHGLGRAEEFLIEAAKEIPPEARRDALLAQARAEALAHSFNGLRESIGIAIDAAQKPIPRSVLGSQRQDVFDKALAEFYEDRGEDLKQMQNNAMVANNRLQSLKTTVPSMFASRNEIDAISDRLGLGTIKDFAKELSDKVLTVFPEVEDEIMKGLLKRAEALADESRTLRKSGDTAKAFGKAWEGFGPVFERAWMKAKKELRDFKARRDALAKQQAPEFRGPTGEGLAPPAFTFVAFEELANKVQEEVLKRAGVSTTTTGVGDPQNNLLKQANDHLSAIRENTRHNGDSGLASGTGIIQRGTTG